MTDPDAPPQDVEAEQHTLGAVFLLGGRAVEHLATTVRLAPEHFFRKGHGAVFQAMLDLYEAGDGIDPETVRYKLEERFGPMDGHNATLQLLAGSVPAVGNFAKYGERVRQMAIWRQRREAVYEQHAAVAALDEEAYQRSLPTDTAVLAGHDGLLTPELLTGRWIDWYDKPKTDVITTPWRNINEGLFGGFRPGDTTILAGWSGMGKSTAGDHILEHAVDQHDLTACLYPNEMSEVDRVSRQLAARAGVSFKRIMRRELSPEEARRALKAATNLPFAMQPCAGWGADAICSHLRRYRWGIAYIDLATRIPARKTADWDYISGAIADAARQSGTHVILSVQLNRERSTSPERPMPVLRDLRNTGAWEADARNVLFVHRREEIDRESGVPVVYDDGVIQLAKVSNGMQGAIETVFLDYQKMRFRPLAGKEDDPRTPGGPDPYEF